MAMLVSHFSTDTAHCFNQQQTVSPTRSAYSFVGFYCSGGIRLYQRILHYLGVGFIILLSAITIVPPIERGHSGNHRIH